MNELSEIDFAILASLYRMNSQLDLTYIRSTLPSATAAYWADASIRVQIATATAAPPLVTFKTTTAWWTALDFRYWVSQPVALPEERGLTFTPAN